MMKTAKAPPPPAEAFSSRRSQPVRQTRTNPQRTSSVLKRTLTRDSLTGAAGQDRPIDIFPAITHFADTMTALPKELVKHFTLLKEVDAKVHLPQESLFRLIDEALNSPMPEPSRSSNNTPAGVASASAPMSTQNSSSGTAVNGQPPAVPSAAESSNSATFAPSDIRRRQLFRQVAFEIKEMLVSLEEKNHVIATANEALQKQLARIDDVWIPLENEFSDEAKWGSTTHWAYQENRAGRADNAQAERSRREGAASLSAAAQKIAEEMAQRSDSRKQAMAMKRSLKTQQHQESDFDDHEGKQKGESSKKAGGAKSRKPPNADSPATVGLGISNAAAVNGNPPAKRRKVEKTSNGGAAAERAMSSVFGPNGAKPKTNSPRETPAPEAGAKKRKALPGGSGQPKKSRTGNAMSPSVASSPVVGTFADAPKVGRTSPAPAGAPRPASARARQNSTQSSVENPKPRPSSSASNKPNGVAIVLPELAPQTNGARIPHDKAKEIIAPPKPEVPKPADPEPPATSSVTAVVVVRKEPVIKVDESEAKKEKTPSAPVMQTVTTKSGRASKPSTPALATFAEAARSRLSSRASDAATAKRSHKKQASVDATALIAGPPAPAAISARQLDEEEDPLYCYCNTVSYGEMIACDGQGCAREWFHLDCAGLKVAPKGNTKWYCEDCKKRLKVGERKSIGR